MFYILNLRLYCSVPEQQLLDIEDCDLNVVRLCFQVFLPDEHGNFTTALPPIVSNPIYDNRKCFNFLMSVLLACFISLTAEKFKGFLQFEKEYVRWDWWFVHIILATRRLRQEDKV